MSRDIEQRPDTASRLPAGKVLVVEDDQSTADFIVSGLEDAGFVAIHSNNGRDAVFQATDETYDAVILDRMLPGLNGMAVLAALRAADISIPVLLLSNLSSVDERVEGLEAGADDYLSKPFAITELTARLRLLVRRRAAEKMPDVALECGDLKLDLLSREVRRGERRIILQPQEYLLLEYLVRHQYETVTRSMLLEGVWKINFDPHTNIVDVHISRLRKKVDGTEDRPLIHTIRGVGYQLGLTRVSDVHPD